MGFKARPTNFVVFKAARYYHSDGPFSSYEVVLYGPGNDPDEHPHDYDYSFHPYLWKKMGGKEVPPKGHVDVAIAVTEVK